MGLRDFKNGFWVSGVKAELQYLAQERFSGQITYWFEGHESEGRELRRKTVNVTTLDVMFGKHTHPNGDFGKFWPKIEAWCSDSDGPIRIFFHGGEIRRLET